MDNPETDWEHDWTAFARVVSERLLHGATSATLASEFGSRTVTWTGVLIEKELDRFAPSVTIA